MTSLRLRGRATERYDKQKKQLDRMVDRVKPWFMVNSLAHGSRIMALFMVWFMVQFMVSFIKLFLNMVDYPVFFLQYPP